MYSAQNQFPVITQAERLVDRKGKPVEEIIRIAEERESSSAQIRTLFNEQRRTIIEAGEGLSQVHVCCSWTSPPCPWFWKRHVVS